MSDRDTIGSELESAWRALKGQDAREGWQLIKVGLGSAADCRAGLSMPEGLESVLAGFATTSALDPGHLPDGLGFSVRAVTSQKLPEKLHWLGIVREPDGDLELFSLMTADALTTLGPGTGSDPYRQRSEFVERIRAWQDFMSRGRSTVLGEERQTGLYGELQMLERIGQSTCGWPVAVESWKGPLNGLHDFVLPGGSIECKTTVATGSFPADIQGRTQLDPARVPALFLAGQRLRVEPAGQTLPGLVKTIRDHCRAEGTCLNSFESRLLRAGYLDRDEPSYDRTLVDAGLRILHVDEDFPGLRTANVPVAVSAARYTMDLDRVDNPGIEFTTCLASIGAL